MVGLTSTDIFAPRSQDADDSSDTMCLDVVAVAALAVQEVLVLAMFISCKLHLDVNHLLGSLFSERLGPQLAGNMRVIRAIMGLILVITDRGITGLILAVGTMRTIVMMTGESINMAMEGGGMITERTTSSAMITWMVGGARV